MEATVEQITAAITALNDKYWYVVMALLFVAGVWFTCLLYTSDAADE